MLSPKLEQNIAPDGNADHGGATYLGIIHYAGNVGCMFLHRGRALSDIGIAVPAQIRQQQAISSRERLRYGKPEFAVCGKRMEKNYRRAVSYDVVHNFRIATLDTLHAGDLSIEA